MSRSPVRQRTVVEGDRVYNVWEQPGRDKALEDNAERRKVEPRKSSWAKPLASIPEVDREELRQRRPEVLKSQKALERFVNSADGAKYRVRPRGKSRGFSFGGI